MNVLYFSHGYVFNRHELGFLAALADLGEVDVLDLKSGGGVKVLTVVSDNGPKRAQFVGYEVSVRSILSVGRGAYRLRNLINNAYDVIFAAPRLPLLFLKRLNVSRPIILRLWSIRAAKLRDNLRFGAYEDMLLFVPSLLANEFYILSSSCSMAVDHVTYTFARSVYGFLRNRITKVYPPYGYLDEGYDGKFDYQALSILDRVGDDYILSFTSLNKRGPYLKFEAKPHAIVAYLIARRLRDAKVVVAGSTYEDWRSVFNKEPPQNMYLIGGGFSDRVLPRLYKGARLVVIPITNRSISNRLLEALFYGRPIVTSEIARFIHPELIHKEHVYISNWDNIVDDVVKLAKNDEILDILEAGARLAYNRWFSTKLNATVASKLVRLLIEQ